MRSVYRPAQTAGHPTRDKWIGTPDRAFAAKSRSAKEEIKMSWFVVAIAVVIVAIWTIDRRRGSTGASRKDDLPSGADRQTPDPGFNMPSGGGGDGGF